MENTDQAQVDPKEASNAATDTGVDAVGGSQADDSPQQEQSDFEIESDEQFWEIANALAEEEETPDSQKIETGDSDAGGETNSSLQNDKPESEEGDLEDPNEPDKTDPDDIDSEDYIKRFYAKHRPEYEQYALSLVARNKEMTLPEALEIAQRKFDVGEKTSDKGDKGDKEGEQLSQDVPATLTDLDSQIADLREMRKAARDELDDDKFDELTERIDALQDMRPDLVLKEREIESQEEAEYNAAFDENLQKAQAYYPFLKSKDSPEMQRLLEIEQAWQDTDDPMFYDPDKPIKLAQIVAREFGIAPKSLASAKKQQVSQPTRRQATPVAPASGNARTTQQSQVDINRQVEQELSAIESDEDYYASMRKLGIEPDS